MSLPITHFDYSPQHMQGQVYLHFQSKTSFMGIFDTFNKLCAWISFNIRVGTSAETRIKPTQKSYQIWYEIHY